MSMFQMMGLDDKRILTGGYCVDGKATEVKTCHWLKVNSKPARTNSLDGAKFPRIIHFTYTVDGRGYTGKRHVNWSIRCPVKDELITVYCDAENPAKYAVQISSNMNR